MSSCDVEETCDGSAITCPADVTDDVDGDTVCDDDDLCPDNADPSNLDRDDDGRGDACDPCTNLLDIFASKARIKLTRIDAPTGDETLRFKGTLDGVPLDPTIDPVTNGVRVILETDSPGGAFVDVVIPGGEGWKSNAAGTAWRYSNRDGLQGIRKVRIKAPAKVSGRIKFAVRGKNLSFSGVDPASIKGTLIIDSPMAMDGQCGEAIFSGAPGGSCTLSKSGTKISCR
jgi:hypothetical protein